MYLVHGTSGDYEPSFWIVGGWTTEAAAKREAERLEKLAAEYWQAREKIGEYPDTTIPDEEWELLFEAWEQRCLWTLNGFRTGGDPNLDRYDRSTYSVKSVELRHAS